MPVQAPDDYAERVLRDGFAIIDAVVPGAYAEGLAKAIDELPQSDAVRQKAGVYGVRNLLELCPKVQELACRSEVRALVSPILGDGCFAVRATFFDKVPDANWKLRYHQDSAISVERRIDTPGFTAWADKAGAPHVRPPESVLLGMLAVRVHLDDCGPGNGPLKVLVGSHQRKADREDLESIKTRYTEETCLVPRGGALVMRPLLWHASGPAESPGHRRVVHLEFAASDLPNGLEWRSRVAP